MSTRKLCQSLTKENVQCKKSAVRGSKYCSVHKNPIINHRHGSRTSVNYEHERAFDNFQALSAHNDTVLQANNRQNLSLAVSTAGAVNQLSTELQNIMQQMKVISERKTSSQVSNTLRTLRADSKEKTDEEKFREAEREFKDKKSKSDALEVGMKPLEEKFNALFKQIDKLTEEKVEVENKAEDAKELRDSAYLDFLDARTALNSKKKTEQDQRIAEKKTALQEMISKQEKELEAEQNKLDEKEKEDQDSLEVVTAKLNGSLAKVKQAYKELKVLKEKENKLDTEELKYKKMNQTYVSTNREGYNTGLSEIQKQKLEISSKVEDIKRQLIETNKKVNERTYKSSSSSSSITVALYDRFKQIIDENTSKLNNKKTALETAGLLDDQKKLEIENEIEKLDKLEKSHEEWSTNFGKFLTKIRGLYIF